MIQKCSLCHVARFYYIFVCQPLRHSLLFRSMNIRIQASIKKRVTCSKGEKQSYPSHFTNARPRKTL